MWPSAVTKPQCALNQPPSGIQSNGGSDFHRSQRGSSSKLIALFQVGFHLTRINRNPKRLRSRTSMRQLRPGCSVRAPSPFRSSLRRDAVSALDPSFSLLTASSFGDVIGFWKDQRVETLEEKVKIHRSTGGLQKRLHKDAAASVRFVRAYSGDSLSSCTFGGCIQPKNTGFVAQTTAAVVGSEAGEDLQQRTSEGHTLREGRLTASTFSNALGFWRGGRVELWGEKVGLKEPCAGNSATLWGTTQDFSAGDQYKEVTGNTATHPPLENYKEGDEVNALKEGSKGDENVQQRTDEWYSLREGRLTASTFGNALGFWRGRRMELWEEKVGLREAFAGNAATLWGTTQESSAIDRYKKLTGNIVQHLGFKIYKEGDESHAWLGASPDGLIEGAKGSLFQNGGILEVKCPHNKGKPELGYPWTTVPYYYMPQAQGLLEILDRDWMDFFVWTMNGSCVFRVTRDPEFWSLIYQIISEFWWENVLPARLASASGKGTKELSVFRPAPLHPLTGKVIERSHELSAGCPLVCKEVNGLIQAYSHSTSNILI